MPFITRIRKGAPLTPQDEAYNWLHAIHTEDGGRLVGDLEFADQTAAVFGDDLDAALRWDGSNLSLGLASGKFQVGGGLQLWDGAAWQDVPHKGAQTITGQWKFTAAADPGSTIALQSALPQIIFTETDTAGAGRNYWFRHQGGRLYFLQDRTGTGVWSSPHPLYIETDGRLVAGVGFDLGNGVTLKLNNNTSIYDNGHLHIDSNTSVFLHNGYSVQMRCDGAVNQVLFLDHELSNYATYITSRCNVAGTAVNLWQMGCGSGGAFVLQGLMPGAVHYWRVRDAANTANLDCFTATATNNYMAYAGTNIFRTGPNKVEVNDGTAWQKVLHSGMFLDGSAWFATSVSLIPKGTQYTTVTVSGAVVGDFVIGVSHSQDNATNMQYIQWFGKVVATNTVGIWIVNRNESSYLNVPGGYLRVRVMKLSIA